MSTETILGFVRDPTTGALIVSGGGGLEFTAAPVDGSTPTHYAFKIQHVGEVYPRWAVQDDGKMLFGNGVDAPTVGIGYADSWGGTKVLKVDGDAIILDNGSHGVFLSNDGGNARFSISPPDNTDPTHIAFSVDQYPDNYGRWGIQDDGAMLMGNGNVAHDVKLYRAVGGGGKIQLRATLGATDLLIATEV